MQPCVARKGSISMTDVVIVAGARTAVGSFNGAFAKVPAHDLGSAVIKAALDRAKLDPGEVSEVILGQVLTAGQGQNPARQAALNAGIAKEAPAWLVNQICGSGLRAVGIGYQAIRNGDCDIVVAGGQESMSMSQPREEQDRFAVASQNKAESAQRAGKFKDEITAVTVKERKRERIVDADEYIREGATYENVSALRPAFAKDGTVTAGNASGLNDGAAAVVLMGSADAEKRGLTPLARIVSFASAGVDPKIMGIGPIPASRAALKKAGWSVSDPDLIEANEAFAAQACAVNKDLGWDTDKVNVNGGAIAIGHPIGASGGRILVTLLHEMVRRDVKKGLATMCIGGGMGVALCVER
jgi:acetyl-CoA C-acetyltransferase